MGRLISASSPQGAKNHVLKEMREAMEVTTPTPLEVAAIVSEFGLKVEYARTGSILPPEHIEPVATVEEGVTPEPWTTASPAPFEPEPEPEPEPSVVEDFNLRPPVGDPAADPLDEEGMPY
jgi:hypothetical protein